MVVTTSTPAWAVSYLQWHYIFWQTSLNVCLGEYSYITEEHTDKRSEAASGFQVEITKIEDFHAADLSKGDGKEYFRYLHAIYTYGGIAAITRVWLSTTKDTTEGDGRTEDINRNRGGDFLYLCWEYEKEG